MGRTSHGNGELANVAIAPFLCSGAFDGSQGERDIESKADACSTYVPFRRSALHTR